MTQFYRQVSVWQHKDDTSIYVDCMEQTIREVGLSKGFEDVWEVVARMEQQKDLEPFNMEYMGDKYRTIRISFQSKHVFF